MLKRRGPATDCAGVDPNLDDGERRELRGKARGATLDAVRALGGEARRDAIRTRALASGSFTARGCAR